MILFWYWVWGWVVLGRSRHVNILYTLDKLSLLLLFSSPVFFFWGLTFYFEVDVQITQRNIMYLRGKHLKKSSPKRNNPSQPRIWWKKAVPLEHACAQRQQLHFLIGYVCKLGAPQWLCTWHIVTTNIGNLAQAQIYLNSTLTVWVCVCVPVCFSFVTIICRPVPGCV